MIEPVLSHTELNCGIERLQRRRRAAARSAWRLITTNNLLRREDVLPSARRV
jgi:hypothetical protein